MRSRNTLWPEFESRVNRHPSLGRTKKALRASKGVLLAARIDESDVPWRCPDPVVKSGLKPYHRSTLVTSFADTCCTSNLSQSFAPTLCDSFVRTQSLSCPRRPPIALRTEHMRALAVIRRRNFA